MQYEQPLLTIIVPIYNVEVYLAKCVDSIINQTYKNLEIILVDDGSPDNCGKICDEYAAKDSRVIVVHKENGGLSDARNAGLAIAKGEYIGFVDSDDYIKPDMYETLYKFSKENDLDVAMCSAVFVKDGKVISEDKHFSPVIIEDKNQMIYEIFVNRIVNGSTTAWNKFYKRHIISELRFPVGKDFEDVPFSLMVIDKTKNLGVLSECKYYYMLRSGSISRPKNFTKSILDHFEMYEFNYNFIQKNFPASIKYAEYGLSVGYVGSLMSILDCQDYRKHYEEISMLERIIKNNFFRFLSNPYIETKRKVAIILISIDTRVFSLARSLWKLYKNR